MASEYNVVGEHKEDDQHLLVLGDDGRYYDYGLENDSLEPVEPGDEWQVDEPVAGDNDPGTDVSPSDDIL